MTESIQLISLGMSKKFDGKNVTQSSFSKPISLDEFDINIINLAEENLWRNNRDDLKSLNDIKDLKNLSKMLKNKTRSKVVFIYPNDLSFNYNYGHEYNKGQRYRKSEDLRNITKQIESEILQPIFNLPYLNLLYENTKTQILDCEFVSTFSILADLPSCTKSLKSLKSTTIFFNDSWITTLKIDNYYMLINFLKGINILALKDDEPEWIKKIEMFDDKIMNEKICLSNERIIELNKEIEVYKEKLERNNKYKSILYSNGNFLVEVILEILEVMLDVDLKNFIDVKNEDFLVKFENVHLIGEIKGVNSNVKSEHVSQTDVHLQSYIDEVDSSLEKDIFKSILIINHQRSKDIDNREPIHQKQISLAQRNGCLIIETNTLLKIFEKFVNNEITIDEIRNNMIDQTGILCI